VAADLAAINDLAMIGADLTDAVDAVGEASTALLAAFGEDPNDALAGATPYLEMFGLTAGGWLLGVSALAAHQQLDGGDDPFLQGKVATAQFFAEHLLPNVRGLLSTTTAGAVGLFAIDAEHLTA